MHALVNWQSFAQGSTCACASRQSFAQGSTCACASWQSFAQGSTCACASRQSFAHACYVSLCLQYFVCVSCDFMGKIVYSCDTKHCLSHVHTQNKVKMHTVDMYALHNIHTTYYILLLLCTLLMTLQLLYSHHRSYSQKALDLSLE